MGKRFEATGMKFGELTAIHEVAPTHRGNGTPMRRYLFQCDCGERKEMLLQNVKNGVSRTCGCKSGRYQHGHSRAGEQTPTYWTWRAMNMRCHYPSHSAYVRYGGRGITVCDRWRHSFPNFLADMGERPEGATLDRKDSSKGYEPDNCRWATNRQQYENKRVARDGLGKFSIN